MSAKKKAADVEPVDLDLTPVELDPPDPAITRWQELSGGDTAVPIDELTAEAIIPFPRPRWADPDFDLVPEGTSTWAGNCAYRATKARIPTFLDLGMVDDYGYQPATVQVIPCQIGTGQLGINIGFRKAANGGWAVNSVLLTPTAALQVADVLRAAVDLIGGER